jgi:hypothetical protein
MKTGAMLTHRARKSLRQIFIATLVTGGFHQPPVTNHSYFFGLDSGGTIPLFL